MTDLEELNRFVQASLAEVAEAQARSTCELVLGGAPAVAIAEDMAARYTAIANVIQEVMDRGGAPPLACGRGCSWCCHIPVQASPPEVLRIVEFVQSTRTRFEAAQTRQRIEEAFVAAEGLSARERLDRNIPCPFLENHACSIYPVRPISCRQFHSLDVTPCQRRYQYPDQGHVVPQLAPVAHAGIAVTDGMHEGVRRAERATIRLDLVRGARLLWKEGRRKVEEWLRGERTLQEARQFRSEG